MNATFPLFNKLPCELRLYIWGNSLSQLAIITFIHFEGRFKTLGNLHQAVGETYRESRAVMKRIPTFAEHYDWIHFDQYLFFFRDHDFCCLIQAAMLLPRNWSRFLETIDYPRDHFLSLRQLVLVGEGPNPDNTPLEIDFSILLQEIERDLTNSGALVAAYRANLMGVHKFSRQHPEILSDGDLVHNPYTAMWWLFGQMDERLRQPIAP
ncbi:unnamed protein product [Clonostachys rosea]|uniref:2EXR domain-containing protein n=1 Tax=Bionectria ochroleuca TaxID=29856 RepID=A0ABY6UVV5_BIOOC|nr:unnamed protein product [Clonostachys rosea]